MMVSGSISVPSAVNGHLTLNVNGLSTLNYATDFANALNAANASGMLLISDLDAPLPAPGSAVGETVEYTVFTAGESGRIQTPGAYVLDVTPGSNTVTGSGGGDTLLSAVSYGDGGTSYLDQGGNNNITFVSGDNVYIAETQGVSTPYDTITAGSGQDNIITGAGNATVFSGIGTAHIALNDEGENNSDYDDVAVLSSGINTVSALGVSDLISISSPGQVLYNSANAASNALVVITSGGDNLINAGAGNLSVEDAVGGNSIDGGTGLITIIASPVATGAKLQDTITSSTGSINIFGDAGSDFTLLSTTSNQQNLYVAGAGGETLSGAASSSTLTVFANATGGLLMSSGSGVTVFVEGQDATGMATISDTIIAGTGELSVFGGSDNDLTLSQGGSSGIVYVAGADDETIHAAGVYAPMTVFGGNGGNMLVQAGSGPFLFVGGTSFAEVPSATISAGSGGTVLFGNDGDALTLVTGSPGNATFVAAAGNETLDASGFSDTLGVFGYNPADPITGGNVNESVIGGAGSNIFFTGAGYETFVAGPGANNFQIDSTTDGLGGNITIYNYSSGDPITFGGYTAAEEKAAIKSAAPATDGVIGTQITLSDQTTVLFVDAAASQLNFKL